MKPLYIINKNNNWHCQRQKPSIISLSSDFVTWPARYLLDLVFCFSYTDYKFICYLLLFCICLFVAVICYLFIWRCHLLVHKKHQPKLWNQFEFSKNRSSVYLFCLLEASFTSRFCISCWIRIGKCWLYCQKQPSIVFLPKPFLKTCSKLTVEQPCRHICSPVSLLHIFRTPYYKNTYGGLLIYCLPYIKLTKQQGKCLKRICN